MYPAALACSRRRESKNVLRSLEQLTISDNVLPQPLSPATHEQIKLSRIRKVQHLLKADLHPNSIYGTKLPPLEIMTVIQSSETKLGPMAKSLNQYRNHNMPPLKLMRRGKPPKSIQDNVPEFRLSPPVIPFEDDNKRARSLFKPI